jgi:hypothetical protein
VYGVPLAYMIWKFLKTNLEILQMFIHSTIREVKNGRVMKYPYILPSILKNYEKITLIQNLVRKID